MPRKRLSFNQCCVSAFVLESMLRDLVVKIVLQHNPPKSGQARKRLVCPLSAAGSTGRRNTRVTLTKRSPNRLQDSRLPAMPKLGFLAAVSPCTTFFAHQHVISISSVQDRCCVDRLRPPNKYKSFAVEQANRGVDTANRLCNAPQKSIVSVVQDNRLPGLFCCRTLPLHIGRKPVDLAGYQPAGQRDDRLFHPAALGDLHCPGLEP